MGGAETRRAIEAAGVTPAEVDFIVFGTTTPDLVFPNCGTLLQARLGARGCPAFSVETACSGFIYALSIAVGGGPTMGDVEFGYVHDFSNGQDWWARRGAGAYLDGEAVRPLARHAGQSRRSRPSLLRPSRSRRR